MSDPRSAEELRLLAVLDAAHEWPTVYAFKFIVPTEKAAEFEALIPEAEKVEARPSSNGKYTAYTFHVPVSAAQDVLAIYGRVRGFPGLVAL